MRGHTSECGDLGVRLCLCGSDRFFFLVVLVYYNYCTIVLLYCNWACVCMSLAVCLSTLSACSVHVPTQRVQVRRDAR